MSSTGRKRQDPEEEATEREADNHYPTPIACTEALTKHVGFSIAGLNVLECAAGDGAMVSVLADAGAIVDAVEINDERAQIIRDSGKAHDVITGDFLLSETRARLAKIAGSIAVDVDPSKYQAAVAAHRFAEKPYDLVASNPPYGERCDEHNRRVVKTSEKGKWRVVGTDEIVTRTRYRDLALEFVQASLPLAPTVAMLLRVNWSGSEGRHDFHRAHPADLKIMSNRPSFVKNGNDSAEYAWWIWREGMTIGTWEVIRIETPKRGRPRKKGAKPS